MTSPSRARLSPFKACLWYARQNWTDKAWPRLSLSQRKGEIAVEILRMLYSQDDAYVKDSTVRDTLNQAWVDLCEWEEINS